MNKFLKAFLFLLIVAGGIVAVFYVSWFWRMLIVPMILLLAIDLVRDFVGKK